MHASLRSDLELMPGSPVGTSQCGERGPCNAFGREVQHYVQSERRPDCILKITSPWQVVGVQKKFSEWRNKECPNEHTAHTSHDFTAEQWAAAGPSPSRVKVSKGSVWARQSRDPGEEGEPCRKALLSAISITQDRANPVSAPTHRLRVEQLQKVACFPVSAWAEEYL